MDQAPKRTSGLSTAISSALASGAIVLTPNERMAHALRHAFDETMRASGTPRWTPPEILGLDSWMTQLWHRMTVSGVVSSMLLNRTQELSVWRRILAADADISALRTLDPLAEMASSTWHLLCSYNGRGRLHEAGASTDTRAFQRWARSFEQALRKGEFITVAQLPSALQSAVVEGDLPIPDAGLLLVDFDVIPPALADLFESLRQAGYDIAKHRTSAPASALLHYVAADEHAELVAAARWVRRTLESSPETSIAIVVPNLPDRRATIARVFGQVLAPELEQVTRDAALTGPFELSLGRSLAQIPMVATALDLLRWTFSPLPITSVSELLLSPFFGGTASQPEILAAAEFDAVVVRKLRVLRPELSLDTAIHLVESSSYRTQLASLLHRLKSLQHLARAEKVTGSAPQFHGEWSEAFRSLLEASGWTRAANADSLTFQTQRRFDGALDELATLDFDGSRVTAPDALNALTRIIQAIIFAPESREAPVQIMGPLEVGGVPFDALWFLGAGDLNWPQPVSASPLLPWHLQRSLCLPGSDTARDHAAACVLTERIAGSAAQVVFSFAHHVEDGEQRSSPALAGLSLEPFQDIAEESIYQPLPLEEVLDTGIILPPPDRIIRGGAQILQLQAACAFRAFAEHRLHSTEPDVLSTGLDAMERGSLVHAVMERFWNRVEDQPSLLQLSEHQADAILKESIDQALDALPIAPETPWDAAYLDTQRQRLCNLLRPWIELERARPPFAVSHNEKRLADVPLGPLRLSLRVDRIDETETGPLILDYKTGLARPSEWITDRPDAPQLPLYAILSTEPVAGVAFALLRAGDELALKGFADSAEVFGKPSRMSLTMEDQLEDWRRVLLSLAEAFHAGEARPEPKSYPKTCSYCSHRILCRLNPATLQAFDDEEAQAAADLESVRG
jgi:ATP-dependent helicase/nuclease subunit B